MNAALPSDSETEIVAQCLVGGCQVPRGEGFLAGELAPEANETLRMGRQPLLRVLGECALKERRLPLVQRRDASRIWGARVTEADRAPPSLAAATNIGMAANEAFRNP